MDPIWLLAFQFAGRIWYLASNECAPVSESGDTIPHLPTIARASFTEALNLGGGTTGPCSASLSFSLGLPLDRDVWWMVLEGYQLSQAIGEVSIWYPGTTYEQRIVLVSAPFVPQKIPTPGKPLEGDFQLLIAVSVADWPPEDAQITADTWPNAPMNDTANLTGTRYPFVFGAPGVTTVAGNAYTIPASPCWIVDDTAAAQKGLICGAPVDAATVEILYLGSPPLSDTFAVTTEADGLGRIVATVDLSAKDGSWTLNGSKELWVIDWSTGGVQQVIGTNPIIGLGDAALYLLLQRYSENGPERVDVGAWLAKAPLLNAWSVGFYRDDRGDPMDVVTDLITLTPLLWIVGGPHGLRPVLLSPRPAALCRTMSEGRELHWVEDAMTLGDVKVCNDASAGYARSGVKDASIGTSTSDAETNPTADTSQSRPWGIRSDSVDVLTFDEGTAQLAAAEQVRARWTLPILLDYESPMFDALNVQLGEPVIIDDTERGINARAMYCVGRQIEAGRATALLSFAAWW